MGTESGPLPPPECPENPRSLQSWAADRDLEAAAPRMESALSEKDLRGPHASLLLVFPPIVHMGTGGFQFRNA